MNYNHPNRRGSTIGIKLMCATVFLLFSFSFLYWFQGDVLAAAQHVLSHGLTRYNRLAGASLITLSLMLVQVLAMLVFKLHKRFHFLTYLPSMLMLGFITDVNSDIDLRFSLGGWLWALPLVLVLWVLVALLAHALQDLEPDAEPTGIFSRAMWINLLLMSLMMTGVAVLSNTNAVFHYRMRAESALLRGDWEGALQPGRKSLESDANLLMIRTYALSRSGQLGERLFQYPVSGGSDAMLPVEGKSRFVMYPVDSLYRYLGARPVEPMPVGRYLQMLQRRDSIRVAQGLCDSLQSGRMRLADYQLCGLLVDKRIDDFVSELQRHYGLVSRNSEEGASGEESSASRADSLNLDLLPRHYREALTLYTHLRSNPRLVYHNSVMDEDWQNLQELESRYADPTERKGKVEDQYRGTYWYYFEYE